MERTYMQCDWTCIQEQMYMCKQIVTNHPLTQPNYRKLLREYFTSNGFLE